ncbi:hypothetical protein Goshw_011675 [Gossypium schwendimanii]|uniref:Uncharacterized protein n=1 Tax=Gossypium schwendimanii TaxID=34291 RepID=A0A7J9MHD3_GOSSC|nr:hypothetical protein [Gossypium schwendimanii]
MILSNGRTVLAKVKSRNTQEAQAYANKDRKLIECLILRCSVFMKAASTNLSSLTYASNPPKPISAKAMAVTTNFTSLSYSFIPSKLISNNPSFF